MKVPQVKHVLSKWLLTIIVVFGFFTFSGLTIPASNNFNKPDTMLIAGFVNRKVRSISYSAASKAVDRNIFSNLTYGLSGLRALSFLHSREADVAAKRTSKLFVITKKSVRDFLISARCPASDDSHPFI